MLDKRRKDGQEDPASGLHNNSSFQDLESFLESVLVPSPVSIGAELVPSILSRGLGLATYSESLGQQGSNDRRSGRPRSSVSNGVQGNTNTNNNNTAGVGIGGGAPVPGGIGIFGAVAGAGGVGGVVGGGAPVGVPKVTGLELVNSLNNKDEAKNNLVTTNLQQQSNAQNNQVEGEGLAAMDKARRAEQRKRQKTRKRDNNSTAGGTSRKKKAKDGDKMGLPATNVFPLPPGVGPQMPAQYVFGMPQMGMPSQMPPQQLQQMQQQLQQQMQHQMGQMGQLGLGQFPQAYMYGSPIQLPDGRVAGFYPGMDQFPMSQNADMDADQTVKRSRLVWTSDLHKKFLDAVERCGGIEHALPKAIMNDMKVMGLTRENVSSHLQKYRIRVKETERLAEKDVRDGEGEGEG